MPVIASLTSFSAGTVIKSSEVNANFTAIRDTWNTYGVLTDVARTITAIQTFSAVPVFSAGITVSVGGAAITGNSTIVGTLSSVTTLGCVTLNASGQITAGGIITANAALTIATGNLVLSTGQAIAHRYDDGDSSTADTIDFQNGNYHKSKLTGNCTYTFSNAGLGSMYVLECLQDATGSRVVTWPAAVLWDNGVTPTLTTTANRKDIFVFLYNGAKYIGTVYAQNINDTT